MLNKFLTLVVFSLVSTTAFGSNCQVLSSKDRVLYAGYTINYSKAVQSLLESHGFEKVAQTSAPYEIIVTAKQRSGRRFKFAKSTLQLSKKGEVLYSLAVERRCLMVNCAVSDMAKSLQKLFRRVKDFPSCPNL